MEGTLQLPVAYNSDTQSWHPGDNDALSVRSRLHNTCLVGRVAVKGNSCVARMKRAKGKWTCTTVAGTQHTAKKVVRRSASGAGCFGFGRGICSGCSAVGETCS